MPPESSYVTDIKCYLTMNEIHLFELSTHLHHFQVIECAVYV